MLRPAAFTLRQSFRRERPQNAKLTFVVNADIVQVSFDISIHDDLIEVVVGVLVDLVTDSTALVPVCLSDPTRVDCTGRAAEILSLGILDSIQ